MELIGELKNKFDGAEIVTLKTNKEFGFTINWLKATKKRPYHLLFTSGLSNNTQGVIDSCLEYKHIELYFCLPDYWKIEDDSPDHNWPIHWLNKIAEVPQKNKSWFGPGDTLPAGKPPKQISSMMEENHFILAEPMKVHQLTEFKIGDKNLLIGHGDGIGPKDGFYKFLKKIFRNDFFQWLFAFFHHL